MQKLSTSTGTLAASAGAQAVSIECTLTSVQVTPAAANATLTVYDGTSTAGVVVASILVLANTATTTYAINIPCVCNKGIFYTLVGAGSTAVIHYVP